MNIKDIISMNSDPNSRYMVSAKQNLDNVDYYLLIGYDKANKTLVEELRVVTSGFDETNKLVINQIVDEEILGKIMPSLLDSADQLFS